jgi:hypothetical protein
MWNIKANSADGDAAMTDIYTTSTELYSYEQAWTEAARLQARGYVTRVQFDGYDWRVSYATHADYLARREGNSEDK